jgi:MFS superfamily sulfate permease-like transporter
MDVLACLITFFSAIFFGMEYGILLGVVTSIGIFLIRPVQPKIQWNQVDFFKTAAIGNTPVSEDTSDNEGYLLMTPESGFSFPSVDFIRTSINETIFRFPGYKYLIIDCQNMISLDYTAATALAALCKGLKKSRRHLLFFNCNSRWPEVFKNVGLTDFQTIAFHDLDKLEVYIKSKLNDNRCIKENQRLLSDVEQPSEESIPGGTPNTNKALVN